MKIKLVTAIATAIIFTMVPAIPAAAGEAQTVAAADESSAAVTEEADSDASISTTAVSTQTETKVADVKPTKKTTTKKTAVKTAAKTTAKKTAVKTAKKSSTKKTAVKSAKKTTTKKVSVKAAKKTVKKAYVPVNAKKLTASYKAQLKKKRASRISVRSKSLAQRTAFEEKSLIGLNWSEFKKAAQIDVSRKEFDLMCRVVSAEAGDSSSYTAKELTAEVIVNRARNYKGSNRVTKALYAKGQFTVVHSSVLNRVTLNGETVNAVKDALIKNSHPKTLYFFAARRYFSWAKPYMAVDGSYFCLKR